MAYGMIARQETAPRAGDQPEAVRQIESLAPSFPKEKISDTLWQLPDHATGAFSRRPTARPRRNRCCALAEIVEPLLAPSPSHPDSATRRSESKSNWIGLPPAHGGHK